MLVSEASLTVRLGFETGSNSAYSLDVDPFGFWPTVVSAIYGLGGNEPSVLEGYVFHTPYIFSGGERLGFKLMFEGLVADGGGELMIRVHRMPVKSVSKVIIAHKISLPLAGLIEGSGTLTLEMDTVPGDSYAMLCLLSGHGQVSATGLEVQVSRDLGPPKLALALDNARNRLFGSGATQSVRHLLSYEPPNLADPVSQVCTAAQFEEPVYRTWLNRMAIAEVHLHRKQWEFVYILQALARYGAIGEGRRGIGFGVGREQLAAVLASMGCEILGTDLPVGDGRAALWGAGVQHSQSLEGLRYSAICPDDIFDKRVSFQPVDMNAIPPDLIDFDFSWSSCAFEHLGSIRAGLRFVEKSLDCVKPGGLVVHTTELNLTSNRATVDHGETVLFRRRDIEALAKRLRGRGHEVFPIKYDLGRGYADTYVDVPPYTGDAQLKIEIAGHITTSFGIIVRKALTKRARFFGWLG